MKLISRLFRRPTASAHPDTLPNRAPALGAGLSWPRRQPPNNRWREQFNPMRGLGLARATSLLEAYARGEMADLQWTYFWVEGTDPDLFALLERRTSALLDLDWNVKVADCQGPGRNAQAPEAGLSEGRLRSFGSLAGEQQSALREAYEHIDNLYEAIQHLALAAFRGFAHVEKHRDAAGAINHLEVLDQWNVVRDGLGGDWKYNPEACSVNFKGLPESMRLPRDQWIIRETKRHVDRIGLLKWVRSNLAQGDWDAYLEVYGQPSAIIIGPPNASPEQLAEYATQAKDLALGGSGCLPNGASVQFGASPHQPSPFQPYLRFLTEQLVLAGTGGILTMLATSGTGTLAGSVHAKAFEQIARAEARQISEAFQRDFDAPVLGTLFSGQPQLAYFELAAGQAPDITSTVDQAVKLGQAGFRLDPVQLSERTGYRLEADRPASCANGQPRANPGQ